MGASGGAVAEPKLNGAIAEELAAAAEEAGLQYVSDDRPGYTRRASNGEFDYSDTRGKKIRDEQRLLRIKRLAIPPAWTDVWICPSPNGHIQATGRDARRRKQYRYHERWREVRDENKFDRLAQFAKALPNIRRRVAQDLKLPGLPRRKVLATIVRLLERTFIRIGNEEVRAREQIIWFDYPEKSSCQGQRHAGALSISRQERASSRSGHHRPPSGESHSEVPGLVRARSVSVPRSRWEGSERYITGRKRLFAANRRRRFYCERFPHVGWNCVSGNGAEHAGSVSN